MSFRVTFVHAVDQSVARMQMFGIHFMPVWAYTLAAHLSELPDLELRLDDLRVGELEPEGSPSDVYLFTGINQDYEAIMREAKRYRERAPKAKIVLGGPICWSYETAGRIDKLEWFDHLFVGDGEETLPAFLRDLRAGKTLPKIIRAPGRFNLEKAKPMHDGLLRATVGRYYGGVLEVSRGCPFLCEFCDIRIQPDNNRSHVKQPELLVSELDRFWDIGVRQALLACDNFIGNHVWAEEVCDRVIEWKARTGKAISLYTWLTIDVSRHPRLLEKLRAAGFDMFFIGVESFNKSSLLETAKVQNTTLQLVDAIRSIQSYGFVVVAGLIMGFDTDPEDVADITLRGILAAGLISGDPSLLTALPGTPLHKRMNMSGRLRDAKLGLGGFKYQTNIRYLRPSDRIRDDFQRFVREFNRGSYQLERLRAFLACFEGSNYRPPATRDGYANIGRLLRMTLRHPSQLWSLGYRMLKLVGSLERLAAIVRATALVARMSSGGASYWFYFKFWLFNWSNSLVKYSNLSAADFDIESVPADFKIGAILPDSYESALESEIPESKVRAQRRHTVEGLRKLIGSREGR